MELLQRKLERLAHEIANLADRTAELIGMTDGHEEVPSESGE